MRIDGEIMMITGVIPTDRGQFAWAILSKSAKNHLLTLTRLSKAFIAALGSPVTSKVRESFKEGKRWQFMLGIQQWTENQNGD